jgi:deoxyribodipyrimidine photo-lyase
MQRLEHVDRIATPFAPVGPVRARLDLARPAIERAGLAFSEIGRRYDALAWPAATRGFFNLRSRIPSILTELGITGG